MAAPLTDDLLFELKGDLVRALVTHTHRAHDVADARHALSLRRAHLTAAGLEGRNAEERAAHLQLATVAEQEALDEAEQLLAEAKLALDIARLEWDCVRYRMRLYIDCDPFKVAA
jgi:multidrug resistance efflux pump